MHCFRRLWFVLALLLCLAAFALQSSEALAASTTSSHEGAYQKATACGTPAEMAKQDFGWGSSFLSSKYQTASTPTLCDTKWPWNGVECLHASDILAALGWPADLLQPQYLHQGVCVPARVAPVPTPIPTNNGNNGNNTGSCLIGALGFGVNFCDAIGVVFNHLVLQPIQSASKSITTQLSAILWTTPDITNSNTNGNLIAIWRVILWIVDGSIVLVVAWYSLNLMLGRRSSFVYATIISDLPRILFAVLAAHFSLNFFLILINGNNALASVFTDHQLIGLLNMQTGTGFVQFLQAFYGIMGILLAFSEVVRIALLSILLAFSPLWMFWWALAETQGLARICTTATIGIAFLQAIQLGVADVGGHLLATLVLGTAPALTLLNLLTGIVILYIDIFLLPKWLSTWIFQSAGGVSGMGKSLVAGAVAAATWISHI